MSLKTKRLLTGISACEAFMLWKADADKRVWSFALFLNIMWGFQLIMSRTSLLHLSEEERKAGTAAASCYC